MSKKSILIIFIEIFVLLLVIFITNNIIKYVPQCWIYESTGILCPSCGGTRCVQNLFQGNFKEAFFSHMVFFIFFIYLLICNIVYIINLNRKEKIAKWIYPKYWHVIIFAILIVIYTIIRNLL